MPTPDELAKMIANAIEAWSDGYEFRAHYASDGDGHFDFMALTVNEPGRKAIAAVISLAIHSPE